jgi:quercetin dioxygenase-like cupin family protein
MMSLNKEGNMRRVVTGHTESGKSVFVSDGVPPRIDIRPSGNEVTEVWATQGTPVIPVTQGDPTIDTSDFFPGIGSTSLKVMRMPSGAESGMHVSDTVDYGIVVSGEVCLELDDGKEVRLKQGDCVVQNGTRHNWRNRGAEVCVIAFVLIGAKCNLQRQTGFENT